MGRVLADDLVAEGSLPGLGTGLVLAVWFALAVAGNVTGVFWANPDRPPIALLAAVAVPPILFALAYRSFDRFAAFVRTIDLRLLTAVQSWRVIGGVFLVLHAQGLMPGLFAYPAGGGDLLVGGLAPFALIALIRRSPGWHRGLIALNLLGLLDFVGAIGTGLLASPGPLGILQGAVSTEPLRQLPLSLIPTFGVPLWILVHIAALIQLHRPREEA